MTDYIEDTYDVVVVGGGAAGLSGALLLARSRRSVLVIDAGEPLNAPAAAVHGFLSRDGISPSALMEAGRSEVRGYGGTVVSGQVRSISWEGEGFAVSLDDGQVAGARRLLVTMGSVAEIPDVPGVRERWGRDVLHCPYCHGWEVRDRVVGILATGPRTTHGALLFRQLTPHVTVFLHTAPQPSDEEREQLEARGISVVEGEVECLEIANDHLTGIRLRTGKTVPCDALAVAPRFIARADVLAGLGIEVTEHPMGAGTYVESDDTGLTAMPGVWVAGVLANPRLQVIGAAAGGSMAGAALNADLVAADTAHAVQTHRDASSSNTTNSGAHVVQRDMPLTPSHGVTL
jgi:thioredoxin reductase